MLYFTLYNGYVSEQYHVDYINNLLFYNSRIHSKHCQQTRTALVGMSHNARRLGKRGGRDALHPRITQAVEGCRKLLVTTPTAISLSRLLCEVKICSNAPAMDGGRTFYAFQKFLSHSVAFITHSRSFRFQFP